ncbi:MAG: hypothetical protein SGPRY_005792 [Prymnesium sp.]
MEQKKRAFSELRELIGLGDVLRREELGELQRARRQREYSLAALRGELHDSRVAMKAAREVRAHAMGRLAGELGCSLLDMDLNKGEEGAPQAAMTKERFQNSEAMYAKLCMLFGSGESCDVLVKRVVAAYRDPRLSTSEKIQKSIDAARGRQELLTAELARHEEAIDMLKYHGDSSSVGYVIHSPRTGEIIDFGGSEEVIALGHKCLTARRAKDVLARRSGEVALLLAGAETSLQGLNQRTSLAEQASEGGAIAITGVVYHRLVKMALAIQCSQNPGDATLANVAISSIADALPRDFDSERPAKPRKRRTSLLPSAVPHPDDAPAPAAASSPAAASFATPAAAPPARSPSPSPRPLSTFPCELSRASSSLHPSEPDLEEGSAPQSHLATTRSQQLPPPSEADGGACGGVLGGRARYHGEAIRIAAAQLSSPSFRLEGDGKECTKFVPLCHTNVRVGPLNETAAGAREGEMEEAEEGGGEEEWGRQETEEELADDTLAVSARRRKVEPKVSLTVSSRGSTPTSRKVKPLGTTLGAETISTAIRARSCSKLLLATSGGGPPTPPPKSPGGPGGLRWSSRSKLFNNSNDLILQGSFKSRSSSQRQASLAEE